MTVQRRSIPPLLLRALICLPLICLPLLDSCSPAQKGTSGNDAGAVDASEASADASTDAGMDGGESSDGSITPVDAGLGPIGSACTVFADGGSPCASGLSCSLFGGEYVCLRQCGDDADCGQTGGIPNRCIGVPGNGMCVAGCAADAPETCVLPGFVCLQAGTATGACVPDCRTENAAFCPVTQYGSVCNSLTGQCEVAPCTSASECSSRICYADTRAQASYCVSDCRIVGHFCPAGRICDPSTGGCDALPPDAGPMPVDAGPPPDAGPRDAGPPPDLAPCPLGLCSNGQMCVPFGTDGLCTRACRSAADCGSTEGVANRCGAVRSSAAWGPVCIPGCSAAEGVGCGRSDLVCDLRNGSPGTCAPDCRVAGVGCVYGLSCDSVSGICEPRRCGSGQPCSTDEICRFDPTGPIEVCVADCRLDSAACPANRTCDTTTAMCEFADFSDFRDCAGGCAPDEMCLRDGEASTAVCVTPCTGRAQCSSPDWSCVDNPFAPDTSPGVCLPDCDGVIRTCPSEAQCEGEYAFSSATITSFVCVP